MSVGASKMRLIDFFAQMQDTLKGLGIGPETQVIFRDFHGKTVTIGKVLIVRHKGKQAVMLAEDTEETGEPL